MNVVRRLMSPEEFLDWCQGQEERFEFVNGQPQAMTGATQRHDEIVVNLIATLKEKLKGGRCRPRTADVATRIPRGNLRRPDVTIDCGRRNAASLESIEPTVVFEVLSPSTRGIDLIAKAEEYKTVPTLRHIVLIEPDEPHVAVWTRTGERWTLTEETELAATIMLDAVSVSMELAAIYDGLDFKTSETPGGTGP